MRPSLPVVAASFSTSTGSVCAVLDASEIVADASFDAARFAVLVKANFSGPATAHVLMDYFVSRRGDAAALKVIETSAAERSGLRGRILSGDFVRLVARTKPDVMADFDRDYRDDPDLRSWFGQVPAQELAPPRPC